MHSGFILINLFITLPKGPLHSSLVEWKCWLIFCVLCFFCICKICSCRSTFSTFPGIFERWWVRESSRWWVFLIFHLSIKSRFSLWILNKDPESGKRRGGECVWAPSHNAAKVTFVTDFGFLSLLTLAESGFVVWPACFKDSTRTHKRVPHHFCHPKGWYLSYNGGK